MTCWHIRHVFEPMRVGRSTGRIKESSAAEPVQVDLVATTP